jgi:hypothetical protein
MPGRHAYHDDSDSVIGLPAPRVPGESWAALHRPADWEWEGRVGTWQWRPEPSLVGVLSRVREGLDRLA